MKGIFSRMMLVGRVTVFTVGLTVTLAVMFGVATVAVAAAPGDPFRLGRANIIDKLSVLRGSVNSAMLRVINRGEGTALELFVKPGNPPLTVNSGVKVNNLNADRLDGQDSSAFLESDGKAADADKLDGRELSTGRVTRDQPPNSASAFTLLQSGPLSLVGTCENNPSGARARVDIRSAETNSAVSAYSVQLRGVERYPLGPGFTSQIASTGGGRFTPVSGAVDHAAYSAVAQNGDILQGEAFAGVNMQGNTCVFSASGIG